MRNNAMISEKIKVNQEILGVTSAAGTTSLGYDMQGAERAMFVATVESTALTTVAIDLMESSAATVAGTSAAGSKAGIVLGGNTTLINSTGGVGGVRKVTMAVTTATTTGSFTMALGDGGNKTFTWTNSTANLNSSAWSSTLAYWGSTVGSTAAGGLQAAVDSIKLALASTVTFGDVFDFSTGTTATLGITLTDDATGNIGFNTTVAHVTCQPNVAVGAFDLRTDEMGTTANKRYLSLKCASAATAVDVAVSCLRLVDRTPDFPGYLST